MLFIEMPYIVMMKKTMNDYVYVVKVQIEVNDLAPMSCIAGVYSLEKDAQQAMQEEFNYYLDDLDIDEPASDYVEIKPDKMSIAYGSEYLEVTVDKCKLN